FQAAPAQALQKMEMVRVNVAGNLEFGNGAFSVMVPAHWENSDKERVRVTKDGTYGRGSFGLEASSTGQKRIQISVQRHVRPQQTNPKWAESELQRFNMWHTRREEDFLEREVKYAKDVVKVGDYRGNLMSFVMFPSSDKVRVKYDVSLRNSSGEFIYVSMQSFVYAPVEADRKLFLEIVASIQVPKVASN
ncbi:MAG: hypothetical protein H7Y17_06985, partial [Chlorobia bacterium]|nr:hypothetical protein [Fimbriimonadaceae bacterium]